MSKSASRARLAEIIRKRSFGRGEITLASGRKSDFYFNLKPTMLDPEGAALLAELTYEALKDDNLDFVGGLEMGAVPLAGAIAQLSWIKGHPIAAFFVRKKPKEHGARLAVEGLAIGLFVSLVLGLAVFAVAVQAPVTDTEAAVSARPLAAVR